MAGKKKIELFIDINNEKEFEHVMDVNKDKLICAEIYCEVFGPCQALDRLFTTIKFDWSDGQLVLLKVLADEIEALERFREHSEPVYMFIINKKTMTVFRGVDSIRFAETAKRELQCFKLGNLDRATYELNQALPDEMSWITARAAEAQQEISTQAERLAKRQSARKRHRAELMIPHLQHLNFVLFWPHAKHAHPELYERWDDNNIIMVGREELQLDQDKALDVLYGGDASVNEASLHALLSGPALAICFRLLDTDKHFATLVHKILYEEIPEINETRPAKDQHPQETAFDHYKSYSPTREQISAKRHEDRENRREQVIEQRARRLSEMQRLARQSIEEAIDAKKRAKEELKIELLKSGNLYALEELRQKPDDVVDIEIPEELLDEMGEESSDEEDPNEYFPPAGLLIPGFYAPPNDISKVNGLAILFPRLVHDNVVPEPEWLPPHVLVMLHMNKRHAAIKALAKHKSAIIHMGIFKASTPYDAQHIAYSVKQYEKMNSVHLDDLRLALMLSIRVDLPLLELMVLNPLYVSRDGTAGELECAAMFSVGYGDGYPCLEDFD